MGHIPAGQVVLVTGATGAIGFEIAAQAAEGGAIVGVHGSREETVADAIARIRERAPDAKLIPVPGNFARLEEIEAVVEKVATEGGRLDAVIHCSTGNVGGGGRTSGVFAQTDPADYVYHAHGLLVICQQLARVALPHLVKRGGTFISYASDAGRFAAARQSMVGAAFGGIMMFVRNLAMELARDGVRVHCISPTYVVDTPIFDKMSQVANRAERAMARAGLGLPSPRDLAPVTLFLCGPEASKITGQVISVNGGLNA